MKKYLDIPDGLIKDLHFLGLVESIIVAKGLGKYYYLNPLNDDIAVSLCYKHLINLTRADPPFARNKILNFYNYKNIQYYHYDNTNILRVVDAD